MKIYNSRLGRLGNAIFRYFASSLFCIIYDYKITYTKKEVNMIFNDQLFIVWMENILADSIPIIPLNNYEFYGYYQHDQIYIKFKNELLSWMNNNLDDRIYTDGNDENTNNYNYNAIYYSVRELIIPPPDLIYHDIVIHIRLEDFIENNYIINPNSIIKLLKDLNKNKICIVVNKLKTDLEIKYIDYIKNNINIELIIQSGTVIEDFHVMKNAKILICSFSTLSWCAAFMSTTITTLYFPNKNKELHETFSKPIENTILYNYNICSKIELEKILSNKSSDTRLDYLSNKLLNYLKDIKNGIYIEVGAYDGIIQSNTQFLEDYYNWTGILIEPNPYIFDKLIVNRPNNININKSMVSDTYDNTTITGYFNNGLISSINKIYNLQNLQLVTTHATTLNKILETHNLNSVDLLSIDTSGYEYEVLKGLNLIKHHPTYIFIEIIEQLKENIFNLLIKNNYKLVENITNYNKIDNPHWDGSHNDYLFKYDSLFDIVIPCGPNDKNKLNSIIEYTKKNIIGYRNIYIITHNINIIQDDCIIIDENIFPFNLKTISIYLGKNERIGWYLQQLLKLYASFVIPNILNNYLVIDCDTYFLKPTSFFSNSLPLYNFSNENHTPYFEHMYKLHPTLKKTNLNKSGICHHMIFQKNIINNLFILVEKLHKKKFYEIFLESINKKDILGSGASEYEIYFNYLQIYHNNKFIIRELYWTNSKNLLLENNFDYISCHWYL